MQERLLGTSGAIGATWAPGSREALPLVVAAAAAVSVGGLASRWPIAGISLAAALVLFAAATRISLLGAVQFLLALLPWMLVFDAFIPPLTRTFVTAAAAAGVLSVCSASLSECARSRERRGARGRHPGARSRGDGR